MNRQKGLVPILIVILIALAVGGYFVYQNQTKPVVSQPITQSSPIPVTSPTATNPADMANWKTYISIDGKYSIQYPEDYTIEETNSVSTADKYPSGKKQIAIKPSNQKLNFIMYVNYYPIPSPAVTSEVMQQVSACDVVNAQKTNNASKGVDFILDNQKGVMYENSLCAQFTSTNFYVSLNNRVYSISVASTEKYNLHKTLVEQILSTFKFLNQNQMGEEMTIRGRILDSNSQSFDNPELTITSIDTVDKCNVDATGNFICNALLVKGKTYGVYLSNKKDNSGFMLQYVEGDPGKSIDLGVKIAPWSK